MQIFDLAISYVWEYDEDFVNLLESHLHSFGISTYLVKEHNVIEVTKKIIDRKLYFNFYFDRAWDVDDRFGNLGKILARRKCHTFNPYKNVLHAIDKASMHLEFITSGLNVPYSIIIPPFNEEQEVYISVDDLAKLGRPFIIKPCNTTGGGLGVVTGAETLKEVLAERMNLNDDKYLIQEKIHPKIINGRRAWFRSFYAWGKVIPCWWDDSTHLYDDITEFDHQFFNYKKLIQITKIIANLTKLDFFSTEIVITEDKRFIVIDYVNDQCDLRFKSLHHDGVPDAAIYDLINQLVKSILRIKKLTLKV